MPTLAELRQRTSKPQLLRANAGEQRDETLIRDSRGQLRPTHVVEQKLTVALRKSKL